MIFVCACVLASSRTPRTPSILSTNPCFRGLCHRGGWRRPRNQNQHGRALPFQQSRARGGRRRTRGPSRHAAHPARPFKFAFTCMSGSRGTIYWFFFPASYSRCCCRVILPSSWCTERRTRSIRLSSSDLIGFAAGEGSPASGGGFRCRDFLPPFLFDLLCAIICFILYAVLGTECSRGSVI